MKTVAIANQKGGVGKTTTAVNLGAGLAIEGYRVLMIDLDSQCNLTRTFLAPDMIQNTLANVLIDNKGDQLPFRAAIYETHIENLDLAAAHIRLARLEKSGQFDDLFRLKDALASLTEEYDFALIDCPPSLGVVVTQALRQCCKHYFRSQRFLLQHCLCRKMEEALDKLRMAHHVISVQSFDLTLPQHIHSFNPFERSFRRIKTLEAL
jgi:cellulose biosynthesis protein BcsQ